MPSALKVKGVVEGSADRQRRGGAGEKDTWSAKKGRDALSVDWDEKQRLQARQRHFRPLPRAGATPGAVAAQQGNVEPAFAAAKTVVKRRLRFSYLAHAAMEPLNCVMRQTADGCEVWNGEQLHTGDQHALAAFSASSRSR